MNANVDGAGVSFDGSSACITSGGSCDTEVVTTTLPFRSFTVQKPGYQIFNGRVNVWPAKGETVNLYATLDPVPPTPSYGSIYVVSHPSGAVVTLDGGNWQYTPATFSPVGAGANHNLQITMSGYQPYGTSVYVAAGQTATVNAYLVRTTPYPATGSLNIETIPAGADIYVDGTYIAESPYIVGSLSPGSHILRLHRSGYDEYIAPVTVTEGRQTPVTVRFNSQHASVGSIEVASTPAGSALYLDGNYMGQTLPGSYSDLTSVLEGTHTVLVQHTDFQDYSQTVFVRGGAVVTVNAVLNPRAPLPVPDTTGQIVIVSAPAGAEVFLDNTFRGITPVTLADIPAGSHTVTAKQAGWTDASQVVTVTGGQSTPVALTLMAMPKTTMTPLSAIPVIGSLAVLAYFAGRRKG